MREAGGPPRRGTLVWFTILSAVLMLPALVLAGFSAFLFDDPAAGATSWVLAIPFMTLPLSLLLCVPASWLLQRLGHRIAALRVAAFPAIHLALAVLNVVVVAAVL